MRTQVEELQAEGLLQAWSREGHRADLVAGLDPGGDPPEQQGCARGVRTRQLPLPQVSEGAPVRDRGHDADRVPPPAHGEFVLWHRRERRLDEHCDHVQRHGHHLHWLRADDNEPHRRAQPTALGAHRLRRAGNSADMWRDVLLDQGCSPPRRHGGARQQRAPVHGEDQGHSDAHRRPGPAAAVF